MTQLSSIDKREHLLILFIKEPVTGGLKFTMASETSPEEANYRYQSLVLTLLKQLKGLSHTDIRFIVRPADGIDAVKFWILSELEGTFDVLNESSFLFSPTDDTGPYTISFIEDVQKSIHEVREESLRENYSTISIQGMNCPECGARWIHMAQLLATTKHKKIIGYTDSGSIYLSCTTKGYSGEAITLPSLPKVKSANDWETALTAPIGGKLNKIYRKLTGT